MQRCNKCGGTGNKHYPDRDLLPAQCKPCQGTGYENPTPYTSRKYSPCSSEDYARILKRYMQLEGMDSLRAVAERLSLSLAFMKERLGDYAGEFKD